MTRQDDPPLQGIRVVEFAGIGPAPFAAMMLADMGAEIVQIVRPGQPRSGKEFTLRGKILAELDLKNAADSRKARSLIEKCDVLIEGFRPGVMERLGLGPEPMCAANPRLIYGRMTGWGQSGTLAAAAGHDINYIAITGMLAAMGAKNGKPAIPLNIIGDFGGGAMFLVAGILAGLIAVQRTGRGQIIDAAVVDGVNLFSGFFHSLQAQARWNDKPGTNILDGGAPFYNTYQCADGEFIAVGAIEPGFYQHLCVKLGLQKELAQVQDDPASWPQATERLAAVFRTKTRAEWCEMLEGSEACLAPVLHLKEAAQHHHNIDRGSFREMDGLLQPMPAPQFSNSASMLRPIDVAKKNAADILETWSAG